MVDFTMCDDDLCPSAKTCRRNELSGTKGSAYQSYSVFVCKYGEDKCTHYYPVKPSDGNSNG